MRVAFFRPKSPAASLAVWRFSIRVDSLPCNMQAGVGDHQILPALAPSVYPEQPKKYGKKDANNDA
jgi:hypothetical protein